MCAGWKLCINAHIVSNVASVLLSIRELMRKRTNLLLNSAIRYTVNRLNINPVTNDSHPFFIPKGIWRHNPQSVVTGWFAPYLKDKNQNMADITTTTGKVNLLVAIVFWMVFR